jgi:hypothetical protein
MISLGLSRRFEIIILANFISFIIYEVSIIQKINKKYFQFFKNKIIYENRWNFHFHP